jgi:hypothetical protein
MIGKLEIAQNQSINVGDKVYIDRKLGDRGQCVKYVTDDGPYEVVSRYALAPPFTDMPFADLRKLPMTETEAFTAMRERFQNRLHTVNVIHSFYATMNTWMMHIEAFVGDDVYLGTGISIEAAVADLFAKLGKEEKS